MLTTPGEKEERENSADIESAAWYRYKVGYHMVDNKKKKKMQYAAPEALYDLDVDISIKTIHDGNDHRYVGLPGAATLDLRKKSRKKVVCLEDSEDEEDNMSEISNLSREALIDLICK